MKKNIKHNEDPEVQIENAISQSERFIEKNGKKLLVTLCVIVVFLGGYFAYNHLYKMPEEQKASSTIFVAQQFFTNGDFEKALNGDDNNPGFLEVLTKYGSTPTGNIASHYVGICYLNLGDFNKAITYLNGYSQVDGKAATIINAQNKGLIGDAYVELKDNTKALTNYEMAISLSDNGLTTPYYLLKAAGVCEAMGNNAKAIEFCQNIKNNYFQSLEARDIDKYIGRLSN